MNETSKDGALLSVGTVPFFRKRTMVGTLREMGVGETVAFPVESYGSLMGSIYRLRKQRAGDKWNVIYHIDRSTCSVVVKRVS